MNKADIYNLGVKTQCLLARAISEEKWDIVHHLRECDHHLVYLCKQLRPDFDFIDHIASEDILFVGEGNLSFARTIASDRRICPEQITASTFESLHNLQDDTKENAAHLRHTGATVLHDIDATQLHYTFTGKKFARIIFQFPHTGSRVPVNGRNPNHLLIKNFLTSAANMLSKDGAVLISAADTPHYHGAFSFEEAAEASGFSSPEIYRFEPSAFIGYTHTMTHEEGDALSSHETCATWVFTRM